MRFIMLKRLLLLPIIIAYTHSYSSQSYHLSSVFNNQSAQIASFIDHVLRQLPSHTVIEVAKKIMMNTNNQELTDEQFYEKLCKHIQPFKSSFDIMKVIKLIRFQKNLLAKQIEDLLKDTPHIHNCLEIGTPATYASTIKNRIDGEIYALLENRKVTDVLQAHSFNPFNGFKGYHHALNLNTYEPISSDIPDNNFDVIICTIGLHHVPPHKLDAFVESLKRVLRPGGKFLLREHNACTAALISLAYAAHSIYNALIPQETLEAERSEMRNFHALIYWKQLLEKHGFEIAPEEYLQEGDSTFNTFIRCTKKSSTFEDHVIQASAQALNHKEYARDSAQTYLTTPEWNNVDTTQQYGSYITKTPFYEFPYMAHVKTFWRTFAQSWRCAAQDKGSNLKVLFSPNLFLNYTLMNLFIGTFMTIEYSAKAAISLPIRALFSGVEASTLLALIHDPDNELANIDPSLIVKAHYDGSIKLVSIPRYMQFLATIKKLQKSSITFIKIANNEKIICKIRYKEDVQNLSAWNAKFTWKMPTLPEYTYAAYLVPVKDLKIFMGSVEQSNGELLYIHDF